MTDNIRLERINRLLDELEYEVTRGVMEREIEPRMGWEKTLPGGPTGYVSFSVRLTPSDGRSFNSMPSLRVVAADSD